MIRFADNEYCKLSRPDGWDFYTGNTINYAANIGKIVKPPKADKFGEMCSEAVIHASKQPLDCFIGQVTIPCRAYRVAGIPIVSDNKKCGFTELEIIEELTDLDDLFQFQYAEAMNPVNPLLLPECPITEEHIVLLKEWDSVRDSVWASVWNSVRNSVWDSVLDSVWASVWDSVLDSVWASVWDSVLDSVWDSVLDSVWASVWDSVWASVRASVRDSVWAYIGSLFPNIKKWKYIDHEAGEYPYQSAVMLWKQGIFPSYDGKTWRLHSGIHARIVWQGEI